MTLLSFTVLADVTPPNGTRAPRDELASALKVALEYAEPECVVTDCDGDYAVRSWVVVCD